ncbi:MAG: aspartate kinase [Alphaproteobacteria bacterium]|nr:aspartate kinase [Alphaproteobacteria bacterium]MCD8520167.1 aspartate kinase [Alphaproteobacteria bacterium]MCD8526391.1 aspartate kinase [Alphaproteobacteria bacterium]MCD8571536.1 aspartate kinase [Alphaproteobacteria bacterium]
MALIVAKFGGTSVADVERIEKAAAKVAREVEAGHQVVVVVSAMSGVTNQLVGYCDAMSKLYDTREYDVVVASGEQVTAGLMAIALQKHNIVARSWMGWQVPIITDDTHGKARIEEIKGEEIMARLNKGEVAVIPGFQGVSKAGRITTLGRGGSDTSAVAVAAALKADRCDIYTDVDGVYTTDPRIVPQAQKMKKVSYEEMLELASLGAKVLQTRSVEIAMKMDISLQVLSSFEDHVGSDYPGTLVTREEEIMEHQLVSGIAFSRDEAKVTLIGVPDVPGVAARLFDPLATAAVNVDMIVQNVSADGKTTDMTFTVSRGDLPRALKVIENMDMDYERLETADNVAKVSVVGIGMRSHSGVANTMFKTLASKNINIQVISTSEIKISVLIGQDYTELAVRSLHQAYGLDGEQVVES